MQPRMQAPETDQQGEKEEEEEEASTRIGIPYLAF